MVEILRREGWVLNPNDRIVNSILKRVEQNNGECPCVNSSEDKHCPCSNYRLKDTCCCGLYMREKPLDTMPIYTGEYTDSPENIEGD